MRSAGLKDIELIARDLRVGRGLIPSRMICSLHRIKELAEEEIVRVAQKFDVEAALDEILCQVRARVMDMEVMDGIEETDADDALLTVATARDGVDGIVDYVALAIRTLARSPNSAIPTSEL